MEKASKLNASNAKKESITVKSEEAKQNQKVLELQTEESTVSDLGMIGESADAVKGKTEDVKMETELEPMKEKPVREMGKQSAKTEKKLQEPVKENTRKAAPKKSPAKKTAKEKKPVKKVDKAAKKAVPAMTELTYIQYHGKEVGHDELVKKVIEDWNMNGNDSEQIEKLEIYVKPEEGAVYYVINGNPDSGKINF